MMNCGPSISTALAAMLQRELMAYQTTATPNQPSSLLPLVVNAFDTAFRRWNPQHLQHIQPCDKPIIDVLFSPTTCGSHRDYDTNIILSYCQLEILAVIANWKHTYSRLTKNDLHQAIAILQTDTWDTYQDFQQNHFTSLLQQINIPLYDDYRTKYANVDLMLPSVAAVEGRIYEMDHESELLAEVISNTVMGNQFGSPRQPAAAEPLPSQTFPATSPQAISLPSSGNINIIVRSGATTTNKLVVQDGSSATSQATNQLSPPPTVQLATTTTTTTTTSPMQQQITVQTGDTGAITLTIESGLTLNSLFIFQFGTSTSQEAARPAHQEPSDILLQSHMNS